MAGYANPLRSIRNLKMGRTDQGVDVTGTGPVYAIGSGVIEQTYNSGWPGGGFIMIRLDNPIGGQRYYYTAEDITPVSGLVPGQTRVQAGQQIGTATMATGSGLELGWAAGPPNVGESAYRAQAGGAAYPEGVQTAQGKSFAAVLQELMSGKQPAGGTVTGTTVTTGTAGGATLTDVTQGGGGGTPAAAGGCMIALVAWPVLIPWALLRRARSRSAV